MQAMCCWLLAMGIAVGSTMASSAQAAEQTIYELRQYQLAAPDDHAAVDAYLSESLLPALKRQNIGPVGVFTELAPEEATSVYLLVPYESLEQFAALPAKLAQDEVYMSSSSAYRQADKEHPAYVRFQTTLLKAFSGYPAITLPVATAKGEDRIFEMRMYPSHNEERALRKIDMFNSGEYDIFAKVGIESVFYGQVLAGNDMPNLMYMVCFKDTEAQSAAWKAFSSHPDWKALSGDPQWKNAVMGPKIKKWTLKPKAYSQI